MAFLSKGSDCRHDALSRDVALGIEWRDLFIGTDLSRVQAQWPYLERPDNAIDRGVVAYLGRLLWTVFPLGPLAVLILLTLPSQFLTDGHNESSHRIEHLTFTPVRCEFCTLENLYSKYLECCLRRIFGHCPIGLTL